MRKGFFDEKVKVWEITSKQLGGLPAKTIPHGERTRRDKDNPAKKHKFIVQRAVWGQQHTNKEYLVVIQRIFFPKGNSSQLRFAYWTMGGKKGRMHGKWTFGQYALMIPLRDFKELMRHAERKLFK